MATAGSLNIISRADWKARAPKKAWDNMKGPADFVFIHHSAGAFATDPEGCMRQVQGFQDLHMDEKKFDDIGYSFVVGEDGNVYEGRGWGHVGAHTKSYNAVGIGICIIGNFNSQKPSSAAVTTVQGLISYGVDIGHISPTYTLKGHRDVGNTECPGHMLYDLIQSWPRYAAGE